MTTTAKARLGLVALLVVAAVAIVIARRTDPEAVDRATSAAPATPAGEPAPLPILAASAPAVQADGWLNTEPLAAVDLAGKVVLYEFWTFGCSNCRAVLPYVEAWHERYAKDGLVVLSIHTPEFDYEADPDAVADFVDEEGVTYPVALDPDRDTWRAFENHAWPAIYLHDQQGRRRLVHLGEGRYDETEDAIRQLLDVAPDAERAEVRA